MNSPDKVSWLRMFKGYCITFSHISYLLNEVFMSFSLPLLTLIGTLRSLSDLSLGVFHLFSPFNFYLLVMCFMLLELFCLNKLHIPLLNFPEN